MNNKRIAKNTLFLYLRQLLVMLVSIYTSRVVLETLGVVDYGIYNVVGGVVVMLSFLNGTMASATQRFLSYEMGKGEEGNLQRVFAVTLQLHVVIALIVVLLAETVGLWLLYDKMQIPAGRFTAALAVYHCSVLSVVFTIMSVPYNAVIISHEHMSAFARISIIEVVLKLGIVYLLWLFVGDRLILYAVLMLLAAVLVRFIYMIYCKKHYFEVKYIHVYDRYLMREMLSFAGWNMLSNIVAMANTQGVNILLNIYFGPIVNAARGLAVQVQNAVSMFCMNLQMSVQPQMTKSYAAGLYPDAKKLMFRAALFSYYLLLMLALPLYLRMEEVLAIWLVDVPEHTAAFVRILISCNLLWAFTIPITNMINSTGCNRTANILHSVIVGMCLPLSYIAFKHGASPEVALFFMFLLEVISMFVRKAVLRKLFPLFSVRDFIVKVYLKSACVTVVSFVMPAILSCRLGGTFVDTMAVGVVSVFSVALCAYFLGLTKRERQYLKNMFTIYIKSKNESQKSRFLS